MLGQLRAGSYNNPQVNNATLQGNTQESELAYQNSQLTAALETAHTKQKEAESKVGGLEAEKKELARENSRLISAREVEANEQRERRLRYVISRIMGKNIDWAFYKWCEALCQPEAFGTEVLDDIHTRLVDAKQSLAELAKHTAAQDAGRQAEGEELAKKLVGTSKEVVDLRLMNSDLGRDRAELLIRLDASEENQKRAHSQMNALKNKLASSDAQHQHLHDAIKTVATLKTATVLKDSEILRLKKQLDIKNLEVMRHSSATHVASHSPRAGGAVDSVGQELETTKQKLEQELLRRSALESEVVTHPYMVWCAVRLPSSSSSGCSPDACL